MNRRLGLDPALDSMDDNTGSRPSLRNGRRRGRWGRGEPRLLPARDRPTVMRTAGTIGFRSHEKGQPSMRHLGQLLLVTLVRGVLFLVPVVLIAVLAREGYQMLR